MKVTQYLLKIVWFSIRKQVTIYSRQYNFQYESKLRTYIEDSTIFNMKASCYLLKIAQFSIEASELISTEDKSFFNMKANCYLLRLFNIQHDNLSSTEVNKLHNKKRSCYLPKMMNLSPWKQHKLKIMKAATWEVFLSILSMWEQYAIYWWIYSTICNRKTGFYVYFKRSIVQYLMWKQDAISIEDIKLNTLLEHWAFFSVGSTMIK